MIALDTNVILQFLVKDDKEQYSNATNFSVRRYAISPYCLRRQALYRKIIGITIQFEFFAQAQREKLPHLLRNLTTTVLKMLVVKLLLRIQVLN